MGLVLDAKQVSAQTNKLKYKHMINNSIDDMTHQQRLHFLYDKIKDENVLKERLFILAAKRSIVPTIQDSAEMRIILERLFDVTGDMIYTFK